jgi:hypothetical protein
MKITEFKRSRILRNSERISQPRPAVQDKVAVEGVDVGVGSPKEMNQVYYLIKVVKLGPARTSKEMSSPSDLSIKEKMETCYIPPRRSWHCILAPTTEMMHVRSGSQRSNLCCRSPPILMQCTSKAQATQNSSDQQNNQDDYQPGEAASGNQY